MTSPPVFPPLLFFGAGKMGGAMLKGALTAGWPGRALIVLDPNASDALKSDAAPRGFALNPAPGTFDTPRVLILAIKPQSLDAAAETLRQVVGPQTILISIMAGKSIADILVRVPQARKIVRAMPNTPASVGRGITGVFAQASLNAEERALAGTLLTALGQLEWVDREALIDAVTAVSGSGPAYVFYLVEALAKAGEATGLAPDLAMRLARATIEGAGELLYREPEIPAAILRQNVTSPGGTTAAALEVLMAETGMAPLMQKAVLAARDRARALAG